MKNFDTIRDKVMGSIENRVRHAYNQGYVDGYKAGKDAEQKNNKETVKFRVGDEVSDSIACLIGVVTRVDSDILYVTWADGSSGIQHDINNFKLTGKHYPLISGVLEQLRGQLRGDRF